MAKINLSSDFAKEIARSLGMTEKWVDEWFDIEEDKQGYFVAMLKPKKYLEKDQFRTMCALVRNLGGEGYLEGMKAWKVPSSFAKKSSGVTPHVVSMDKSKPTYTMVPIKALFSMPFQSRITEDPELEEFVESIKVYGVLEPILVRPKPDGRYEIVAGERRVKAADKAGLIEIPVVIRFLTDQEAFEVQFVENDQRKDYTDTERGRWLRSMLKRFPEAYPTQEALAKKLGKTQQWVSGLIRMVDLIDTDNNTKRFVMLKPTASIQEVQALIRVEPEKRGEVVDKIKKEIESHGAALSVSETKKIIKPEEKKAPEPSESTVAGPPEEVSVKVPTESPEPKPEPVDIAEVTCSVCGITFRLAHHGIRDHRVEYYAEGESKRV